MNLTLWILQILLAVVALGAGAVKLIQPRERLAETLGDWVDDVPPWLPRFVGLAEVFAAVGLIVPPLTGAAPVLVPLAAVGMLIVMIGAAVIHVRRGETRDVAVNILLALIAAVIAWGRFGPYPF